MAFTPVSALIGGALIGASASMMLAFNGRIAGISGVLGGLVRPQRGDVEWRITFMAGLLAGGVLLALAYPRALLATSASPIALTVIAGLLVGFGTQLGGGTDINRALAYCQSLVRTPHETILVLISDLYEGGNRNEMIARAAAIANSGVQMIALLALATMARRASTRALPHTSPASASQASPAPPTSSPT